MPKAANAMPAHAISVGSNLSTLPFSCDVSRFVKNLTVGTPIGYWCNDIKMLKLVTAQSVGLPVKFGLC